MLYLDLGNSCLKIGYKDTFNNLKVKIISLKELNISSLKTCLNQITNEFKNFSKALLASVNFEIQEQLLNFLKIFKIKTYLINHKFLKNNLKILINQEINFNELGIDILLNSYFISQKYNSAILVSLGTASVITKISDQNLLGVIIMPGVETSLNSLFHNASLINPLKLDYEINKSLGTNTQEAISIGIIKGFYYSIQGLINDLNENNLPVFYTGGNLKYFQNLNLENIIEYCVINALDLIYQKCKLKFK